MQSPMALLRPAAPPFSPSRCSVGWVCSQERRAVAAEILGTMKKLYPNLVEQASFVSQV